MEKSQLERKIQKKVADMFAALEQDLDVKFPDELKIRFSDGLCDEAEVLFKKIAEAEKTKISRKTLSKPDVINKIDALIANRVGDDAWNLDLKADLYDDLGYDSLACVELMLELERTFVISIDDDAFEKARTVADVRRVVLNILEL